MKLTRASILTLLCITILSSGCAPVLVGGLIYKSTKSKQDKEAFMDNFRRTNVEREQQGLYPLDFCAEVYRFDPGWARSLGECSVYVHAMDSIQGAHSR